MVGLTSDFLPFSTRVIFFCFFLVFFGIQYFLRYHFTSAVGLFATFLFRLNLWGSLQGFQHHLQRIAGPLDNTPTHTWLTTFPVFCPYFCYCSDILLLYMLRTLRCIVPSFDVNNL